MLQLQKEKGNVMVLVKEPNQFITGRYKLSLFQLKLLSVIFSKVKKDTREIILTIKEIKNFLKIHTNDTEYLKKELKELIEIVLEVENEKKWIAFPMLSLVEIDNPATYIKTELSTYAHDIILNSKHYLEYNIELLLLFNSAYTLRLYKLLKDRLEHIEKFNIKPNTMQIKVEDLKDMLKTKYKRYADFNRRVIKPAVKEINEKSDIQLEVIEDTQGRKVESLIFYITRKSGETKKSNHISNNKNNIKNKKINFVEDLRKKVGEDKIILLENDKYTFKENLLYKNDKLLTSEEALDEYKYLKENKDHLKIVTPEEFKDNNKKFLKDKILNTYKNIELKAIPVKISETGNIEYINAYLIDIEDFKTLDDFIGVLKTGEKEFKMRLSLQKLKNFTK